MAFESLQHAWSSERILYRDQRWLVVDKPAGVPCGGAREGVGSGLDLGERLAAHGLGAVSPLLLPPGRASGASWFEFASSAPAGAAPPAILVECVVALEACRLAPSGQLEPGFAAPNAGRAEAAEAGWRYRVLRRNGPRALVELSAARAPDGLPELLARHGHPIVGDAARGGAAATRLWLHVQRLEGSGLAVNAPLPAEFEAWLLGAAARPVSEFDRALAEASLARSGLWAENGAFRLLGEEAGEIAGLTLDRYGDYAVLGLSSEEAWEQRFELAACVMDRGARAVYAKRQLRVDLRRVARSLLAPEQPLSGSAGPVEFTVQQQGLVFAVSLNDGLSTGLFLDQRANWQRLRAAAQGASVLNSFCYTGAFSVAAGAGGASSVVSVDLSGRALARTRRNLQLNGLEGPGQRLLKDDALRWFMRAARAGRSFDRIVLDPPSFGTRARGVLRADRDYEGLVVAALGLLAPGGQLLCVSHQREQTQQGLSELARRGLDRLGLAGQVEPWIGDWDCPSVPGVSGTKSVLAKLS